MSLIQFTPEQMQVMDFSIISYEEALRRGFAPSKDGDLIWAHESIREFWSQGLPFCDAFFRTLFQLGAAKGADAKMREIREALGLE